MGLGKRSITVAPLTSPSDSKTAPAATAKEAASPGLVEIVTPYLAPEPHSPKPEAGNVLQALRQLQEAYARGDFQAYEQLLDDDCSDYDERTSETYTGKANIVAHLQKRRAAFAEAGGHLLIDHPIVKVVGETAVVTYRLSQKTAAGKAAGEEAFVTCIFLQNGDQWKKLHEASKWNKVATR
jgi:ketosteroid isomerase-like protein